jgi:transcriptional regulator with XRE-family HTH domain
MTESLDILRTQARATLDLPPPAKCRAIREAAGVPRAQLVLAIGVSEASIAFYERGLRTPRGQHRIRYVEALSVLREEVRR